VQLTRLGRHRHRLGRPRQILAIKMAGRESRSSWEDLLRAASMASNVVADDHAGLRVAIREVLAGAA